MISTPNERMEAENRGNSTTENCPFGDTRRAKIGSKGRGRNVCFYREKKRKGKRGHRDNPTLRVRNPSIIAPTTLQWRDDVRVDDYRRK
jgi:hypothetical protein